MVGGDAEDAISVKVGWALWQVDNSLVFDSFFLM
jgi:hypothetical protein